jgi:hypothetical protein
LVGPHASVPELLADRKVMSSLPKFDIAAALQRARSGATGLSQKSQESQAAPFKPTFFSGYEGQTGDLSAAFVLKDAAHEFPLHILTADERDHFEERAAIIEFDAGLPKSEAECLALAAVVASRR